MNARNEHPNGLPPLSWSSWMTGRPMTSTITGPGITTITGLPTPVVTTYCAKHPDVKTGESGPSYGWQSICEKCAREAIRTAMTTS